MNINLSFSREKISEHFKCDVTVTSEELMTAIECRATKIDEDYGTNIGLDILISEGLSTIDGVYFFSEPSSSFTFDVSHTELFEDANYRISVYACDINGSWGGVSSIIVNNTPLTDSEGNLITCLGENGVLVSSEDNINTFMEKVGV